MKICFCFFIFWLAISSAIGQKHSTSEIGNELQIMMDANFKSDHEIYWNYMHPNYFKVFKKSKRKILKELRKTIPNQDTSIITKKYRSKIVVPVEDLYVENNNYYTYAVIIHKFQIHIKNDELFEESVRTLRKNLGTENIKSNSETQTIIYEGPMFMIGTQEAKYKHHLYFLPFNINDVTLASESLSDTVYEKALERIDQYLHH